MKKITLAAIFILIQINAVFGQEPLKHEKKVFFDNSSGKLFWNKSLPFYIRLSTSPEEDAPSHLMHSESTAEYANPAYLDTEGINYIRTRWAVDKETKEAVYPEQEVVWEVYADGIPPETDIKINSQQQLSKAKKIYCKGDLTIEFLSEDAMSGVENIYYSIDKTDFQVFDQRIEFLEEKEYFIQYYAIDHVGNVEQIKQQTIIIDKSSPVSGYEFEGDIYDHILSSGARINLAAEDKDAGLENIFYNLDSLGEKRYESPIAVNHLAEGEHTISFYATDILGNTEKKRSFRFYIDNTPPFVISDLLGDSFISNGREYSSGRSRVKLTAIDNKSGVNKIYYSINGEEYQEYNKPFFLPAKQGDYKIDFYAVDNVGNKSNNNSGEQKHFTTPYLDLTAPKIGYNFQGPEFQFKDTVYISKNTKINFNAVDEESGIKNITYKINNGEEIVFKDAFQISKPGFHQIEFTGTDNVNNSNREKFSFIIDNEGPSIFTVLSMKSRYQKKIEDELIPVYGNHVKVYLSGTDNVTDVEEIYYSVNNDQDRIYNHPITGFKNGEKYHITIKSTDKLGNEEYEELKLFIE